MPVLLKPPDARTAPAALSAATIAPVPPRQFVRIASDRNPARSVAAAICPAPTILPAEARRAGGNWRNPLGDVRTPPRLGDRGYGRDSLQSARRLGRYRAGTPFSFPLKDFLRQMFQPRSQRFISPKQQRLHCR